MTDIGRLLQLLSAANIEIKPTSNNCFNLTRRHDSASRRFALGANRATTPRRLSKC